MYNRWGHRRGRSTLRWDPGVIDVATGPRAGDAQVLHSICFLPGVIPLFWVTVRRAWAGPVGLDGSSRTSAMCSGAAPGALPLGIGVRCLGGGCCGGGSDSRVWRELLSSGLAGASRKVGVALLHPP